MESSPADGERVLLFLKILRFWYYAGVKSLNDLLRIEPTHEQCESGINHFQEQDLGNAFEAKRTTIRVINLMHVHMDHIAQRGATEIITTRSGRVTTADGLADVERGVETN
jgi:hypothetical protein